eukprot:PITA_12656
MAQSKYASDLLVYFQMTECKPATSLFLLGIRFEDADCPLSLIGCTDFDWVGDGTDRKSTYGYVFSFGPGPFFCSSKKQSTIALSTTEAEYRVAVNAFTEVVWLQRLLSEFGIQYPLSTVIFCDNQVSIQILIDLVQRKRNKHIEIHMHDIAS